MHTLWLYCYWHVPCLSPVSFLSDRCFVIDYKRDKYIRSNFRICPPFNLTHAFSSWNEYRYVTVANKHNQNPSLTIIIGVLILYSLSMHCTGLQIYGRPGSLSHDFKVWSITFQGSRPSGPSYSHNDGVPNPAHKAYKTQWTNPF